MDAIGCDQNVGFLAMQSAIGLAEHDLDLAARLLEAFGRHAGDDCRLAEPLAHRVEQHRLQHAAMDRELRPIVAGEAPAGLRPDQASALGEIGDLLGPDTDCLELGFQPHLEKLAHRMRLDVDADAERPDRRHLLKHAGGYAGLVQRQRKRQSRYAAADDNDAHWLPRM
jgi:hypothetical protein